MIQYHPFFIHLFVGLGIKQREYTVSGKCTLIHTLVINRICKKDTSDMNISTCFYPTGILLWNSQSFGPCYASELITLFT